MTYEQWQWQQDLQELFPHHYNAEFVPVWHAAWSDYEESAYIYILQKGDQYYVQQGGYSVVADDNTDYWSPYPVSDAELWEILVDWEEHLD
jgi:hypothetical protein